jgi:hypothetical protein
MRPAPTGCSERADLAVERTELATDRAGEEDELTAIYVDTRRDPSEQPGDFPRVSVGRVWQPCGAADRTYTSLRPWMTFKSTTITAITSRT